MSHMRHIHWSWLFKSIKYCNRTSRLSLTSTWGYVPWVHLGRGQLDVRSRRPQSAVFWSQGFTKSHGSKVEVVSTRAGSKTWDIRNLPLFRMRCYEMFMVIYGIRISMSVSGNFNVALGGHSRWFHRAQWLHRILWCLKWLCGLWTKTLPSGHQNSW